MTEHKLNMTQVNIALLSNLQGDYETSESILRSIESVNVAAKFNLGWHELRNGNLKTGYERLECGRFLNAYGNERIPGELWKDQDLNNKTILFRCEGGYGDQILYLRFAYDFVKLGARVLVSCGKELMPLFSRHGFICIENEYVRAAHYDYWVPAMSAVHMLGYEYEDLNGSPYLSASHRKKLYCKSDSLLKVGLRWSGRPEFEHEQFRRFDPNLMVDLHTIPGATFYSLQRDDNTIDGLPFADLRPVMETWEDTAAIISDLDLVITSCTSIAHLSAAMGKETWVVVPILPYQPWALPGGTSPWYDSVRLFRQRIFGSWVEPFADVETALREKLRVAQETLEYIPSNLQNQD